MAIGFHKEKVTALFVLSLFAAVGCSVGAFYSALGGHVGAFVLQQLLALGNGYFVIYRGLQLKEYY